MINGEGKEERYALGKQQTLIDRNVVPYKTITGAA